MGAQPYWGREVYPAVVNPITSNRVEAVVAIIQAICAQAVEPDGIVFDAKTVIGETIKERADYQG